MDKASSSGTEGDPGSRQIEVQTEDDDQSVRALLPYSFQALQKPLQAADAEDDDGGILLSGCPPGMHPRFRLQDPCETYGRHRVGTIDPDEPQGPLRVSISLRHHVL